MWSEDPRTIQHRRAQELGLPFVDLDRITVDPAAQQLVPLAIAKELRLVPIKLEEETLWVVASEPTVDRASLEVLTGKMVRIALGLAREIDAFLDRDAW
ncbi:MAG: hypothetical protein JSS66_17340 [Armatimonadetes bacterium]|nr:hypothetical protein [Armatimonadota bacterium]